jgi:hypothetical protein
MTRRRCAVVGLIVLFAALNGPAVVGNDQRPSEETRGAKSEPRKPPSTPQAVGAALAELEKSIATQAANIPRTTFPQNAQCPGRGFVRTSVQSSYRQLRSEILATLDAPEAAPLRALLVSEFPREPTRTQNCTLAGAEGVDEKAVRDFFAELHAFLDRAKDLARPMEVVVSSSRAESLSKIRPQAGGAGPPEAWTQSKYPNLFRGFYHLKVRHKTDAYKPYDANMGKLAAEKVNIHCDLAAKSSADDSICAVR